MCHSGTYSWSTDTHWGGPFLGANLAPLVRANVMQLSHADLDPLGEWTPSVDWNGHLLGNTLDNNDLNQGHCYKGFSFAGAVLLVQIWFHITRLISFGLGRHLHQERYHSLLFTLITSNILYVQETLSNPPSLCNVQIKSKEVSEYSPAKNKREASGRQWELQS